MLSSYQTLGEYRVDGFFRIQRLCGEEEREDIFTTIRVFEIPNRRPISSIFVMFAGEGDPVQNLEDSTYLYTEDC